MRRLLIACLTILPLVASAADKRYPEDLPHPTSMVPTDDIHISSAGVNYSASASLIIGAIAPDGVLVVTAVIRVPSATIPALEAGIAVVTDTVRVSTTIEVSYGGEGVKFNNASEVPEATMSYDAVGSELEFDAPAHGLYVSGAKVLSVTADGIGSSGDVIVEDELAVKGQISGQVKVETGLAVGKTPGGWPLDIQHGGSIMQFTRTSRPTYTLGLGNPSPYKFIHALDGTALFEMWATDGSVTKLHIGQAGPVIVGTSATPGVPSDRALVVAAGEGFVYSDGFYTYSLSDIKDVTGEAESGEVATLAAMVDRAKLYTYQLKQPPEPQLCDYNGDEVINASDTDLHTAELARWAISKDESRFHTEKVGLVADYPGTPTEWTGESRGSGLSALDISISLIANAQQQQAQIDAQQIQINGLLARVSALEKAKP